MILIAGALTLVAAGLNTVIVFPGNSASPIVLALGIVLSAVAVPKAHWGLAFGAASAFGGALVLVAALKLVVRNWLDQTISLEHWPLPSRFYAGLLYFIPLVLWWRLSNRRRKTKELDER